MTIYVFHPRSFVTERVHAEWKQLHERLLQTHGRKHIKLWCAIPPGVWNMADTSIGGPFSSVKVL